MTDKEKIRAEIERRISIINNRENKIPADKVAVIQLEAVLSFIDSMQEEPNDDWKYSIAEKLGISREEYDKIDYNKDYGKEDYLSEALDIKYKVENGIEDGDKDE